MWNRLEKFTDRSHRMQGDHRNYSCRRKKMWSTHSCLVQGDQPRTEGKYSTRTRAVMRKWNERTTQLAVIIAENIRRLLPDTRRRRGRVKQIELAGIQKTHGPVKEMPTATNVCQASQVWWQGLHRVPSYAVKTCSIQKKLDFLIISLTGGASSVLKDLDEKPWWPNWNSGMALWSSKTCFAFSWKEEEEEGDGWIANWPREWHMTLVQVSVFNSM